MMHSSHTPRYQPDTPACEPLVGATALAPYFETAFDLRQRSHERTGMKDDDARVLEFRTALGNGRVRLIFNALGKVEEFAFRRRTNSAGDPAQFVRDAMPIFRAVALAPGFASVEARVLAARTAAKEHIAAAMAKASAVERAAAFERRKRCDPVWASYAML